MRTDKLEELDTIAIVERYGDCDFLYHRAISSGVVCSVFIASDLNRRYRAMEYSEYEEDGIQEAHGYCTTEPYFYMGERYKGMFGPFEQEVFYAGQDYRCRMVGPDLFAEFDALGRRTDSPEFSIPAR